MATCSFQEAIGGKSITCGNNIKVSTNEFVPLLACTKPIATHLSSYHIDPKTVESESKLLQLHGGLFFDDIDSSTICPNHRQKLGFGWTCGKFIAPETKACQKTIFPEIIVKFTSDVEVRKSKIMSHYFTVLNVLGTGQYN